VTRKVDTNVEVSVVDTGEGIDPLFLPHVFDRFRQQDSSMTRRYGGLGLGLAIVRHIVELHGGEVRASSDGKGRGATFSVMLPMPYAESAVSTSRVLPIHTSKQAVVHPGAAGQLSNIRVLVIDDDEGSRMLAKHILMRAGAEVVE